MELYPNPELNIKAILKEGDDVGLSVPFTKMHDD